MTHPIKILIIGAGHMGGAIAVGLKRSTQDISMTIIDTDPARRADMEELGIRTLETLPEQITSDVLILAVQPQKFASLSKDSPQLRQYDGLIISVMAGINTFQLSAHLNTNQICRAMPNIACAIGEGTTILVQQPLLTGRNHALAEIIFSSLGKIFVSKEEMLFDTATALVGGGPAYIAYFAASLIEYGISAGLDESLTTAMVIQTLRGTTALLESIPASPMTICEKVMTPNGTTVRAIHFFDSMQLRTIIMKGLKQSSVRSMELGGGA